MGSGSHFQILEPYLIQGTVSLLGMEKLMMGGFGLGFMGIFWVVLIIVGLIFFRQYSKGRKGPEDTGSTPLEILKQRYARGEIDKQEYETKKRDLS
jgi:putative membrane protein